MRARLGAATVLISMLIWPTGRAALAQDDGIWRTTFTPYAWVTGLTGQIGTADGIFDVDLGAGDVIDQVDVSFNLVLETRRGRWFGRLDGTFMSASDRQEVSGTEDLVVGFDQGFGGPEVGYAVVAAPWGGIDLLAGGRFWNLKVDVSTAGEDPIDVASGKRTWLDGIGGLRMRYSPAEKWKLFARGDAGAGGSNLTWQALGGVGFDFSECCGAVAAYRHLAVEYDRDAVLFDTKMSGFALGLEVRF